MLTISQLAAYAGVTVAAVRHYHKIDLLPEPERDRSGYRSYDAAAVVQLIRIHILASAGVPLAHVESLLEADPTSFAEHVTQIDDRLLSEVRQLQETRRRLAGLAAGEQLALPASVVGYLERLRDLGVDERYLEKERDAWIVVAAQVPDQIDAVIAKKHEDLGDPDVLWLYDLVSGVLDWAADDPRVVEVADVLERIATQAAEAGTAGDDGLDDHVGALLDAAAAQTSPAAERLLALLQGRGWKGLTRFERAAADNHTRDNARTLSSPAVTPAVASSSEPRAGITTGTDPPRR
ncbi:MerR family transcriptional regulator [Brachybacterium fresconis]|uniref:DNA-binding transcriptional MerR regulator n=1 Tax=Brachybacterium fresconis TaxID=173363 RepID=A0ABS4YJJ5_9MICO|nr:MerR family transcriptional regulator [Brachybacterium fresconis]MBP2408969.1 DNA-binding transcriptional MerR regulator [Brachybacterium fresconis]